MEVSSLIRGETVYHEYVPSNKSMAGQLFDIKGILKEKYIAVTHNNQLGLPFKLISVEKFTEGLDTLLKLYTKDDLKDMLLFLESEVKSNIKKESIIPLIARDIEKNFQMLLEEMDESMYHILSIFKESGKFYLRDSGKKNIKGCGMVFKYLIQRGFLFRCLWDNEEIFMMPLEIWRCLENLNEEENAKKIKRNSDICRIGKNILYYYGVVYEYHFYRFLIKQIKNLDENKLDIKINLLDSDLDSDMGVRNKDEDFIRNVKSIFKKYVDYTEKVKSVYVKADSYKGYGRDCYSYYSVFDPTNIYIEQQRRTELDYISLNVRELVSGVFADQKPKDAMIEYLKTKIKVNPISAHLLVEEWTCYIKNSDTPVNAMTIIVEQLSTKSVAQMQEMINYAIAKFVNVLNNWMVKGNLPAQLQYGKQVDKLQGKQVDKLQGKQVDKHQGYDDGRIEINEKARSIKTGRNDPCPCDSGKKYKKCCGK